MSSSVATYMAAIKTHAVAAGGTLAKPITDVVIGMPVPKGRCCRIYWDGEAAPPRFGDGYTLNSQMVAQRITATWFWPISDPGDSNAEARVLEMADITHEMRTRVLGDEDLGSTAKDLVMELSTPETDQIANAWWVLLALTFVVEFDEYTIAR